MNKKAALIIIGNEILSGRTKEANLNHIALKLVEIGVDFSEARVIPDEEDVIITTVQELSQKYDYVFTTGGIGTTHDDITAESVAKAFHLPLIRNEEAYNRMKNHYGDNLMDVRGRMALMPEGSELIDNPVTIAPGFYIKNVFVMAGVPTIMQAMLETILSKLTHGDPVLSETILCRLPESFLAQDLEDVQKHYPQLSLGSYPSWREDGFQVHLVVRGTDKSLVLKAKEEIENMIMRLEKEFQTKRA